LRAARRKKKTAARAAVTPFQRPVSKLSLSRGEIVLAIFPGVFSTRSRGCIADKFLILVVRAIALVMRWVIRALTELFRGGRDGKPGFIPSGLIQDNHGKKTPAVTSLVLVATSLDNLAWNRCDVAYVEVRVRRRRPALDRCRPHLRVEVVKLAGAARFRFPLPSTVFPVTNADDSSIGRSAL